MTLISTTNSLSKISPLIRSGLSCIRYPEVLLFQGAPLLGVAFAGGLRLQNLTTTGLFILANSLLFAHIFALNDWGNLAEDSRDPKKTETTFVRKGVSSRQMLYLTILLGLATMFLFSLFSFTTFALCAIMLTLSLFYSHPRFAHKTWPIMSSLNHFLGGITQFLLGYSAFSPINIRGLVIGLYFAIVLVAGHLVQEVRDYHGDRSTGLLTKAVKFGRRRTFLASFGLFTLSYLYLGCLTVTGIFPPYWILLVAAVPFHALLFYKTWNTALTFANVQRYQRQYRLLYALLGIIMATTLALVSGE